MTIVTKDELLKHQKTCSEVCDQAVGLLYPFVETYTSAANAVKRINAFRDKWPSKVTDVEHIAQFVTDCWRLFDLVHEDLDDWIERPRTMAEAVAFYVDHLIGETVEQLPVPPLSILQGKGQYVDVGPSITYTSEWWTPWPNPNIPRYQSRCWPVPPEPFYADYYDTFAGLVKVVYGDTTLYGRGYTRADGLGDMRVVSIDEQTASVHHADDVTVLFTPDQVELLETLFGGKPAAMAEKVS